VLECSHEQSRSGAAEAVIPIPLAPKLNSRTAAVDQLDRAAQTILGTIHRAPVRLRPITGKQ
jgi:hypothetical protein